MPSSQAAAAERRNDRTITHEPPKLKTILKTPPKQATNPMQFVKVGPCSLYRTAQEQLQKVQEVKKIKQEVRDDPEDWQSNLDNWKSSRRKRQEHIIERVVEVKKLELEEHDRQRRRSKTFSEMMEERGSRGRKLSMSLALYHEEDSNDLSDLGIGTSSGKSSVSGDTHDDTQSVLSDRDSEIDKNHSDIDNPTNENGNNNDSNVTNITNTSNINPSTMMNKKPLFGNGFHNDHDQREYDSGTTATASSPEPEDYNYEGATRGYANRVPQNIPRHLMNLDTKFNNMKLSHFDEETPIEDKSLPGIKVDIHKRRELFEKASQKNSDNKMNNNHNINNNNNIISNRSSGDYSHSVSIKERLSNMEKQKHDADQTTKTLNRLSGDMSTIRERLSYLEKQTTERDNKTIRKPIMDSTPSSTPMEPVSNWQTDEFSPTIKDRLSETKPSDKANCRFSNQETRNNDNSTPSERSSSPDSEYRAPRAAFHRSLDSLDADASSGPDTFERVQSLEELDYVRRRYPASASSAEILNDTDREDSGIHTADVSCSVSQADEPVDEEIVQHPGTIFEVQEIIMEAQQQQQQQQQQQSQYKVQIAAQCSVESTTELPAEKCQEKVDTQLQSVVIIEDTAEPTGLSSANKYQTQSTARAVIYQSPRVPPRRTPPAIKSEILNNLPVEDLNESELSNVIVKCPDSKLSSDSIVSVNKPSKIPTPLPRKPMIVKISSSSASTLHPSPTKTSPKPLTSTSPFVFVKPTKIPSPLKIQDESVATSQGDTSNDKNNGRRRTVVEICEKVIVTQGHMPVPSVTPFITVTKIGDDQHLQLQQSPQQRNSEESIVIGNSSSSTTSLNEEAKPRVESPTPVEHEEEEVQTNESTTDIQSVDTTTSVCPMVNVEQKVHHESPVTLPLISLVDDTPVSNPLDFEILSAEGSPVTNNMEFIGTSFVLSNSIPQLNLTSDEEIVAGLTFPLGPPSRVEPPKEKPPPPPTDFSDEENQPIEPLKRLNSTRRIKKELRTRRSDFLGIEGINDDDFELSLAKPPDMAAILAEERRIEQLHRRSYDTDSNYEQDSSHERDSGVELGHAEDWTKQPVSPDMSEHSRQSSEPFGASVTSSEEDEITKKEREIIEVLEKEEQWRYGNDREQNSDIGEKLAYKLRELEEEKMQLERERAQDAELHRQEETMRKNDKNARKHDEELLRKQRQQQQQDAVNQQEIVRIEELNLREEMHNEKDIEEEEEEEEEQLRIEAERLRLHDEMIENKRRSTENRRQEEMRLRSMEGQLREQEKSLMAAVLINREEDEYASGEILRVGRELLQLEQEELKRQRNNIAYREQKQQQLNEQLQEQWQSLQDVNNSSNIAHATYQNINMINYRSSMPNLQLHDIQRRRPAPPPIPPAKPIRLLEQRQRDVTIRNSRIPSADSIPQQVDAAMRHSISATALATHAGQQMTKQTLQALSAVPRTRIVKSDQWVQRRKSDGPRITQDYNYQHWLIQEAEQRRINEKNQRSAVRKPQHVTGTSVLYTATSSKPEGKPLPDSIIQTLTQRMQNRAQERPPPTRRRMEHSVSQEHLPHQQSPHHTVMHHKVHQSPAASANAESQEKMLSVSGKKKCSHCGDELGRGAAMIIESLRLFYHMECFKCCVCHVRLGDGLMGTDVRVRNHKLHCHNCYSSDDGVKFSCV